MSSIKNNKRRRPYLNVNCSRSLSTNEHGFIVTKVHGLGELSLVAKVPTSSKIVGRTICSSIPYMFVFNHEIDMIGCMELHEEIMNLRFEGLSKMYMT